MKAVVSQRCYQRPEMAHVKRLYRSCVI